MPALAVSTEEATRILRERISEGHDLVQTLKNETFHRLKFDRWRRDFEKWRDVTEFALANVYVEDTETKRFADETDYKTIRIGFNTPKKERWVRAGQRGITHLEALEETIRFAIGSARAPTQSAPAQCGEIFLVHGHDERRDEVKGFLENTCQSYAVVVLDEQPARGRTLIERLEQHGQDAAYAVILFTGDDLGVAKADAGQESEFTPRARQNVVFEFGWFCGQIGREHVAVLYESDVELPSDIGGLTFIDLGKDDWEVRLARDLRAAGLVEPRPRT